MLLCLLGGLGLWQTELLGFGCHVRIMMRFAEQNHDCAEVALLIGAALADVAREERRQCNPHIPKLPSQMFRELGGVTHGACAARLERHYFVRSKTGYVDSGTRAVHPCSEYGLRSRRRRRSGRPRRLLVSAVPLQTLCEEVSHFGACAKVSCAVSRLRCPVPAIQRGCSCLRATPGAVAGNCHQGDSAESVVN